jgi:purine-nucleoside phosphorylase
MSKPEISLFDRVQMAADAVKSIVKAPPKAAVVLGTGLGGLSANIKDAKEIPYSQIPHFPVSTVKSHAGRVVYGTLEGTPILAFDGRFHYYEGWSFEQITLPVRVAKAVGAQVLFLSGAVGGMNPLHEKGDLVLLEDHISLMPGNPLIGPNDERLGPRFPDMCEPYDRALLKRAGEIALEEKIRAHRGVYVAVPGPNLETRAEYRFLRAIGADVVGMKVFAATIITDRCLPDALEPAKIEEIIKVANAAEPKLTKLVARLIAEL